MKPLPFFPAKLAHQVSKEIEAAKKAFRQQEPKLMEWQTRTAGLVTVEVNGISSTKLTDALCFLALVILKIYCGASRSVCKSDQEFLDTLPAIRKLTFMEVFPSQDRDSSDPRMTRITGPVRSAIDAQISLLEESIGTGLIAPGDATKPRLNVELISKWMRNEGYTNEDLASELHMTIRVVSSMRNDGDYHGRDAVAKLANRMNLRTEDLYRQ